MDSKVIKVKTISEHLKFLYENMLMIIFFTNFTGLFFFEIGTTKLSDNSYIILIIIVEYYFCLFVFLNTLIHNRVKSIKKVFNLGQKV